MIQHLVRILFRFTEHWNGKTLVYLMRLAKSGLVYLGEAEAIQIKWHKVFSILCVVMRWFVCWYFRGEGDFFFLLT